MSIPQHLAKIKSSGIYRFVWDKSEVPPQQAETLRLVIGYSDKGPFNTLVYTESSSEFTKIFGNISKRKERKGVYFHRLAQQALSAGPILALNLKPFTTETVSTVCFNGKDLSGLDSEDLEQTLVKDLYNTNRFWKLDPDELPTKLDSSSYVNLAMTDVKDNSCTLFIRKQVNESYAGIKVSEWFASQGLEIPENYDEDILKTDLSTLFADIYVFKGQFTTEMMNDVFANYFDNGAVKTTYTNKFGVATDALEALAGDSRSNFIAAYSGCMLPNFKDANGNYISLDLKFNNDYNAHKMMMKFNESDKLTSDNVLMTSCPAVPIYFEGYTYSTTITNYYDDCMQVIKDNAGLYEALTNRVDCEYHYIIDTFDTETSCHKAELFQLAKDKDNAFAIVNFPKMSKFTESATGQFNIKSLNESYKPGMPSEVEGGSHGAFFTQLTFTDGAVKSVIPSAAIVSNNFMHKWNARQPYYIVAGPTYGRLAYSGLVGPDYNFGRNDLDVLEPMGINAIVYVPRLGTYINSNQTAKQVPVSGLSKIHIRELVIYLQNEIEALLQNYQWELNTQTLRNTIKSKADDICTKIMNNGGLYAFVNRCDETNNSQEVIDNEMIVLDTEIEPARGAGKMVHQLTIHKTGALSSTVK